VRFHAQRGETMSGKKIYKQDALWLTATVDVWQKFFTIAKDKNFETREETFAYIVEKEYAALFQKDKTSRHQQNMKIIKALDLDTMTSASLERHSMHSDLILDVDMILSGEMDKELLSARWIGKIGLQKIKQSAMALRNVIQRAAEQ
jgi:hypothetical protein